MNVQKTEIIKEGTTKVFVFKKKASKKGPASKDKDPFYNPSMEQNRDLSIIVNQWLINNCEKQLHLLDGLAASGIRGIRLANELVGNFDVAINDYNEEAFLLIKKNISHNKLKNVVACNKNLNVLLSENKYDYIDIDPFGSPVYFIDSAVRSIYNNGVIACTATDTASLCGVYPNVCRRRYGAQPFHLFIMHEIGLRILLGFICREAAKYDKGIEPILTYSNDHFFRVYVKIRRGKRFANESMENHSLVDPQEITFSLNKNEEPVGPLWLGNLHTKHALKEIRTILFEKELNTKNSLWKLISLLEEESDAPAFFYTTDDLASYFKVSPPKMDLIFEKLRDKGFIVTKTHFSPTGFKTDASINEIKEVFKKAKT
jgi:tRNA (guanine26-N2/guanine27-N2)-dimethyltransferase